MHTTMPVSEDLGKLRGELAHFRAEAARLENEIAARETDRQLGLEGLGFPSDSAVSVISPSPGTPSAKVSLFLDLFGTRRSVFPRFWENPKTGRKGYSPVCLNEWRPGVCKKPQVKCSECLHQKFPPLDEVAVEAHLRGHHTLGVYAISEDTHVISSPLISMATAGVATFLPIAPPPPVLGS